MINCACAITSTTSNKDIFCPDCKRYRLTKQQWKDSELMAKQELGKIYDCSNMAYYDGEPFKAQQCFSRIM